MIIDDQISSTYEDEQLITTAEGISLNCQSANVPIPVEISLKAMEG